MKVFVTGATGVAGTSAIPHLLAAGHQVSAVSRSAEKAETIRSWGATPVAVDLFDPADVMVALKGHDAVCNLATHIPPLSRASRSAAWKENDRIRTEASRNLVDAALATDVVRFVQESIAFLYPDCGDTWIDEATEPSPTGGTASALEAEANLGRFTAAGRDGVILRFAQFYGPLASHTLDAISMARKFGLAPTVGDPHGYTSSINLIDVGTAVAAALTVPAGLYNVGDDEPVRRTDLHGAVATALGRKRLHQPGKLIAKVGGDATAAVARSQRVSNRLFKEATGWGPTVRSALDGWPPIVVTAGAAS
jgi:nucleoside-diphosphate-sugar epimerase